MQKQENKKNKKVKLEDFFYFLYIFVVRRGNTNQIIQTKHK